MQTKLDRQALLAEISNNPYAISNYTAVHCTIRRERSILLKSIHIRSPEKRKRSYGITNLTQC